MLSKFSGGIGLAYHRVRSRGSLIESTNGHSNGIVPWLKTLDASVAAVNQGGKRKGACCVYLEPWHADVEEFLSLRDNTGDEASRTHNLNLANWLPDLFMRRVETGADWSLFDPKVMPELPDLYGDAFERAYVEAERGGLATKTVKARELYARMMRTLAQTGNGWITFKDKSNRACNQTALPGRTVHLSNLCTEILEVTSGDETAVCNLGSINLGRHMIVDGDSLRFDFDKLARTVRVAVRQLDRVIDLNYYPIGTAEASNLRWRPVGLGVMGLAGRLLPAAAAVRRARGAGPVAADRRGDLLSRAVDLGRPGARAGSLTRRSRRRAPPAASCSSKPGMSSRQTPRAGRRCARGSSPAACATRCWWRSPRRRRSPRSPAATSASSRRSPTCSSARRCRATSCR